MSVRDPIRRAKLTSGLGTVVASSDRNDPLLSRKVFLVPTRGWDSDPYGPESKCQRSLSAFAVV